MCGGTAVRSPPGSGFDCHSRLFLYTFLYTREHNLVYKIEKQDFSYKKLKTTSFLMRGLIFLKAYMFSVLGEKKSFFLHFQKKQRKF